MQKTTKEPAIKNLKELQKQEASKRLKLLKFSQDVIKDFANHNRVYGGILRVY